MNDYVADVSAFKEQRKDTWLVFSDEIPLWIKIGLLKTVFADWELGDRCQNKEGQDRKRCTEGASSSNSGERCGRIGGDGCGGREG